MLFNFASIFGLKRLETRNYLRLLTKSHYASIHKTILAISDFVGDPQGITQVL